MAMQNGLSAGIINPSSGYDGSYYSFLALMNFMTATARLISASMEASLYPPAASSGSRMTLGRPLKRVKEEAPCDADASKKSRSRFPLSTSI